MNLISGIERLDRNDGERANLAYHTLNLERFLDEPEELETIMNGFDPLINTSIREKLLKHIVYVRDKKYIDKLAKELDQMLGEVKKTDPRHLDPE